MSMFSDIDVILMKYVLKMMTGYLYWWWWKSFKCACKLLVMKETLFDFVKAIKQLQLYNHEYHIKVLCSTVLVLLRLFIEGINWCYLFIHRVWRYIWWYTLKELKTNYRFGWKQKSRWQYSGVQIILWEEKYIRFHALRYIISHSELFGND